MKNSITNFQTDKKSIFEKTGFIFEKKIRESQEIEYGIYCGKVEGAPVLLKIGPTSKYGKKFEHELAVDLALENHDAKSKLVFAKNRVILVDSSRNFSWIIREFLLGDPLSSIPSEDEELFVHPIAEEFILHEDVICKSIIDNIIALESIPQNKVKKICSLPRFPMKFDNECLEKIGGVTGIDLVLPEKMKTALIDYGAEHSLAVCSGDLAPTNIIVNKNKAFFTDFEWFCIDNKTVDVTYLWLFLWKYPKWQKVLLAEYTNRTGENLDFFHISRYRIILYWYKILFNSEDGIDRREIVKEHVWTVYLSETLEYLK